MVEYTTPTGEPTIRSAVPGCQSGWLNWLNSCKIWPDLAPKDLIPVTSCTISTILRRISSVFVTFGSNLPFLASKCKKSRPMRPGRLFCSASTKAATLPGLRDWCVHAALARFSESLVLTPTPASFPTRTTTAGSAGAATSVGGAVDTTRELVTRFGFQKSL
jgi:hypothetical protein